MNEKNEKTEKSLKKLSVVLAVVLFLLSVTAIPVAAWLFAYKNISAYAPVSSPVSLYIGTGQKEDTAYLYFPGIDKSVADHKDFVICIHGEGIANYAIQLAYTTNNQFDYAIYPATSEDVTSATPGAVYYEPHDSSLSAVYYAVNGEAVSGSFLNKDTEADQILAESADAYYNSTYYDSEGDRVYGNVNKYAKPLYWQTSARAGYAFGEFTHYYMLRVSWEVGTNDRETDVLCISAASIAA